MHKSSLLIAVLLKNDPGTFVEIGWMAKKGKEIILYDPYYMADNLFLEKTVTYICHDLTEVIDRTFMIFGE